MYEIIRRCEADPRIGKARVVDAAPGLDVPDEAICFGKIEGTTTFASMRSSRKDTDDEWTQSIFVTATEVGLNAEAARARCEELWNVLYDVVANEPDLGGVVSGLEWLKWSKTNGPSAAAGGDGEGFEAWFEADLVGKARIR